MSRLPDSLRAHLLEPCNPGEPARVDRRGEARNPVCRDHVVLFVQLDAPADSERAPGAAPRIEAAGFRATGCPAAMAYASAATEWLGGRTLDAGTAAALRDALLERFGDPGAARRHALTMVERCVALCAAASSGTT